MAAVSTHDGLDELCRRFLNGDESSTVKFHLQVRPLVSRIARKYAWDLDPDQRDEVMSETMLLLLHLRGRGFDPARGSAVTFVGMVARRAARDVSAQYAPAGRPTRPPSKKDEEAFVEFKRRSHVEAVGEITEEQVPRIDDFAKVVDDTLDAAYLLSIAPPPVAHCLVRVCYDAMTMAAAAAEIGLSRFAVNRMINDFRETVAA